MEPIVPAATGRESVVARGSTSGPSSAEGVKITSEDSVSLNVKQRTDAAEGHAGQHRMDLSQLLTIMVVTSPVMSNPSCELIERVLKSLSILGPSIRHCKRIIVCDGFKLFEGSTMPGRLKKFGSRNKLGMVTPEAKRRYEEYILNIKKRITADNTDSSDGPVCAASSSCGGALTSSSTFQPFRHCSTLELGSHHGFAHAVLAAVSQGQILGTRGVGAVRTPYVLTMQHDWEFIGSFDPASLVQSMMSNPTTLKYVAFPTNRTRNYPKTAMSNHKAKLRAHAFGQVSLYPLLSWFDRNHMCSVRYYTDFVFNWRAFHGIGLKKGQFIEDVLGQKYKTDIRAHGWRTSQASYGTWILTARTNINGYEVPMVRHIDGRRYLTQKVLRHKYKKERARHLEKQKNRMLNASEAEHPDVDTSTLWS